MTDWLSWVLIKCDNDEPGSLPACVEACLGRPSPSTLQGIAPLTSSSVTENTEVIDQSHQGGGGAGFQLLHSWGNTGSFLRLSCYSEALHLLEQCRESCRSLLYEPVVLTEAQSLPRLCHRNILFLCLNPCTHWVQKEEVVGRRREDCTKQINNVMSPGHRNFILAAPLLL